MTQLEILTTIKANPGIMQKKVREEHRDHKQLEALFRKRIVRTEWHHGNNHLFWTGVEL